MIGTVLIPIFGIAFVFGIGFLAIYISKKGGKDLEQRIDINHVNENSFQRYAKFYGEIVPSEADFDRKLNKIYILIKDHNMRDIKQIAEISFCTLPECVLKIKYLKNKRLIDDLYIDTNNMKLITCSPEDQLLIDKFKPYIYGTHTQISEFVNLVPNPEGLNIEEHKKKLLDELIYLDKKGLVNGVKIDDIDGEIIYYALEKRKTVKDRETVHCPNCGALNDVELTGKVRCSYCNSIVMGSKCGE